MFQPDCIFCKINQGQIPCAKIWENEAFVAFLDAFPACKGMTLVLPKEHHDPDIFTLNQEFYTRYMLAVQEVVALLKKWLNVEKIWLVVEGLQVPHAHVKLYPFRNNKSFVWGLTGHEMADFNELKKIAEQITSPK